MLYISNYQSGKELHHVSGRKRYWRILNSICCSILTEANLLPSRKDEQKSPKVKKFKEIYTISLIVHDFNRVCVHKQVNACMSTFHVPCRGMSKRNNNFDWNHFEGVDKVASTVRVYFNSVRGNNARDLTHDQKKMYCVSFKSFMFFSTYFHIAALTSVVFQFSRLKYFFVSVD